MINKDKLEMMAKDKTIEEIKNIATVDPERSDRLMYIIKNCSSYIVTPNENEHWLCGSLILTKWHMDTGYGRGYSRKYYGLSCPDNFETWSFHNDELAGEAFETHYEMENN